MLACEEELLERENDAITQSHLPKHTFYRECSKTWSNVVGQNSLVQ